jgi:hypothetical protein
LQSSSSEDWGEVRWGYFTTDGRSVSQSVCLGIEHDCGTCDQILFPVGMLLSKICGLVSVGRPLWREDGSAIYSVITQWSESSRTRNHTLLSHLRLPQHGGSGSRIYIPQEQGGPVRPPGTTVTTVTEDYISSTKHTNSVRTSQETHYVSATDTNRLRLFSEVTSRAIPSRMEWILAVRPHFSLNKRPRFKTRNTLKEKGIVITLPKWHE